MAISLQVVKNNVDLCMNKLNNKFICLLKDTVVDKYSHKIQNVPSTTKWLIIQWTHFNNKADFSLQTDIIHYPYLKVVGDWRLSEQEDQSNVQGVKLNVVLGTDTLELMWTSSAASNINDISYIKSLYAVYY